MPPKKPDKKPVSAFTRLFLEIYGDEFKAALEKRERERHNKPPPALRIVPPTK